MARLKVLIVEDDKYWREELAQVLQRLDPLVSSGDRGSLIETAENNEQGRHRLTDDAYDLAVVDLALLTPPGTKPEDADEQGLELLAAMRQGDLNRHCAILVVTGTATNERTHRALQDFGVKRVEIKSELHLGEDSDRYFLDLARQAVLEARLHRAAARNAERPHVTFTFNHDGWIESEVRGPAGVARDEVQPPVHFESQPLLQQADDINRCLLLQPDSTVWREQLDRLARTLYDGLSGTPKLYDKWAAAQALATKPGDLWLRFRGHRGGLGIPFDLLKDDNDFLCLHHILTREIHRQGFTPAVDPFGKVIGRLQSEGRSFRALLVAAEVDDTIPGVVTEVTNLGQQLSTDLRQLGVRHDLTSLVGKEATYSRVKEELRSGRYHLFHFAGHGRYEDGSRAAGELLLPDGSGVRSLTANELGLLADGSELHLVFLSCCMGGLNKAEVGDGDFYGIFDALSRVNVATLIGYRWIVADDAALLFASTFYNHLWRTFCTGEAALAARREAAMGEWGRDDQTWAAPVVLVQGGC